MAYHRGDILFNKYRLEECIGQGAFGEAWKATHLTLNLTRAIKILRRDSPGLGSTKFEDFRTRFQLEAQLGAQLNHPNLIQVFDFEQDGDTLALVMEYAAGGSLKELLDKNRQEGKSIPIETALRIMQDIARGLGAIHRMDVVHRDLKPANILFDSEGNAKVADLGLAQMSGGPSLRSQLSEPTPHPGTPGYMSPEQEHQRGMLKSPSDVYALGLAAFEMLTGRNYNSLKPGTTAQSLRNDIPEWLGNFLAQMLAEDSTKRPWDGNDALDQLTSAQKKAAALLKRVPRASIVKWAMIVGGGLLGLVLLGTGIAIAGKLASDAIKQSAATKTATALNLTMVAYSNITTLPASPNNTPTPSRTAIVVAPSHTPVPPSATRTLATNAASTSLILSATPTPSSTFTIAPTISPTPALPVTATAPPGMVLIPAGTFQMGNNFGDYDERPVHTVSLSAYYLDIHEVTNAEYAVFLNDVGNQSENGVTWLHTENTYVRIHQVGGSWQADEGYANHPVIEVTWYGAEAYCTWSGGRLPTEAEWEYAARGGLEGMDYPWGNDSPSCVPGANNGAQNINCDGARLPVGTFSQNSYGLYDMAGNVSEWVRDLYDQDYYDYSPVTNPTGPTNTGSYRVVRGGSWGNHTDKLRVASRELELQTRASTNTGFRCAADTPNP